MLYRTHKRYGILSGLLTIPLAVNIDMLPQLTNNADLFLVGAGLYMGIRGALFGAEFPDCDSYGGLVTDERGNPKYDINGQVQVNKGSVPAQKHPIISKIFKACGVKHRGKFSHDFVSQGVFWGLIYFLVNLIGKGIIQTVANGNSLMVMLANLSMLSIIWIISVDLIDLFENIGLMMQGNYKKTFSVQSWEINSARGKKSLIIFTIATIILLMTKTLTLNITDTTSALKTVSILIQIAKIYIIFTLAGVYSHLIADMMTKSGVSIFGYSLAPAKLLLKLKRFPLILLFPLLGALVGLFFMKSEVGAGIGGAVGILFQYMMVTTDLKTGSAYEDLCRLLVTIACVPAIGLAIMTLLNK